MNRETLFERYQELQRYVEWTDADSLRVRELAPLLEPHFAALIEDFYAEIERHPSAAKVITGGQEQVKRLKGTLREWLRNLVSGHYDSTYVAKRWRVGWRHVEIGLQQVFTNMALSRLRRGLLSVLEGDPRASQLARRSLNTLLDLDLAIIEDAYQAEHSARLRNAEAMRAALSRLEQQQELARVKERGDAAFRGLVEAAPCMILMIAPDRAIRYFSPFAEELTGYAAGAVLGKDYFEVFVPAEHRHAAYEEFDHACAGIPSRGYQNQILCQDGTPRWIVWNVQRLDDYQGSPAILAIGQDITQLMQAQEHALQSERLAAIGEMVTGLAHESGNALARSQACLEMLAWEVTDRPEAISLIDRIQKAHDHLQQLYEDVRGYAAPIKLATEVWDLSYLWRGAWENLAMKRGDKTTALREETAGVDPRCRVDHFRLDQVFRNLFENSLAACDGRVEVVVAAQAALLGGRPAIAIAVRDNGPGLTAEQQRRIFEPFFTTKTKGTGLGMAIVKRIIEAHGGRIEVGTRGPGAEIVITLPRDLP